MCDVPSIAVFCGESNECFPGTVSKFFLKLLVTIPVAPIITGTIVHFRFHIRFISIHKLLYFNFFTASFCTTFLSAGIITYLFTPWCKVLLEKLTDLQLVNKFPAFHGTRRFITANTRVRHLSLSWANPIQSIYPHPTSWRSILILSTHLGIIIIINCNCVVTRWQ